MKPDEPVTRTESGLESMPRAGSQLAPDCDRQAVHCALKVPRCRAPLKSALQVAFVPVTPPVAVPGQMPHVAELTVREEN